MASKKGIIGSLLEESSIQENCKAWRSW